MAIAADVVTVPDFAGPAARLFEARALLFLGSWIDHAGRARDWPLHLACIGEPPQSVRELARRAHARISLHEPALGGRAPTRNKLSGFDVEPETERLLLVDTDVIVLGDPSEAARLPDALALVPAGSHRISLDLWQRVCGALGRPVPSKRILCQRGELGHRLPAAALHGPRHLEPMVPYYNSGVLLVPWRHAPVLRKAWADSMDRLAQHFPIAERANQKISKEDQFGLALTVDEMEREGRPVGRLPWPLHASWLQVLGGALREREVALYHAVHFLRLGDPEAFDPRREADLYADFILAHVYPPGARGRALATLRRVTGEPEEVVEVRRLCARIRELVEHWVAPAFGG